MSRSKKNAAVEVNYILLDLNEIFSSNDSDDEDDAISLMTMMKMEIITFSNQLNQYKDSRLKDVICALV